MNTTNISPEWDAMPKDEDTTINHSAFVQIDNPTQPNAPITAKHEQWTWEAIRAESLVFLEKNVVGMDDEVLFSMLKASAIGAKADRNRTTISRKGNGFVFINFNFISS